MLNIVVTDISAESRNRIVQHITHLLATQSHDAQLLPRVSIKPLSRQELKFHSAPDVCVIGEEIVAQEISEVGSIRELFPDAALLARVDHRSSALPCIEQLARLGVDDIIPADISPAEFMRKIILVSRRAAQSKSGKLIVVDAGKGGVGVTSIVAALGEALSAQDKKVLLCDFDFETQDLSRFLRARPFLNENLELLFRGHRPVTEEFVEQSVTRVWSDEPNLHCMPPMHETEELYDTRSTYPRTLLSVLEIVDSLFDCVIVDVGCARGAFLKTLYRVADKLVFIVNNDPATLYASVDRLARAKSAMSPTAQTLVLENASERQGLPNRLLRQEFNRAAKIAEEDWSVQPIPFCRTGHRWPGSGATLFAHGKAPVARSLTGVLEGLSLIEPRSQESFVDKLTALTSAFRKNAALGAGRASALPAPRPVVALATAKEERLELPQPRQLIESAKVDLFVKSTKEELKTAEVKPLVAQEHESQESQNIEDDIGAMISKANVM